MRFTTTANPTFSDIDDGRSAGRSRDSVATTLDGHKHGIFFESSPLGETRAPHALLAKLKAARGRRCTSAAFAYRLPDADGSKAGDAESRAHSPSGYAVCAAPQARVER
jgi:hypothetical protein